MTSFQTSSRPRRLPSTRAEPSRFLVQDRDVEFFCGLYRDGLWTAKQAVAHGLWTSVSRFNVRARLYFDGGYVVRTFSPFSVEAFYSLGKAACPVVASAVGVDIETVERLARLSGTPSHIVHTHRVVEVKLSVIRAARQAGLTCDWRSERQVRHAYRIGEEEHTFKPDGYSRLGEGSGAAHYFWEVDLGHRSREAMRACLGNARRYRPVFERVYRSGHFAVLCVTTGGLRMRHLREMAVGDGADVLFTTFTDLFSVGPLGPIWLRPAGERPVSLR